ncbi:hypothetical protein F0562_014441 [Nyssa sinensis]|uniref:Uncharacterized protein n=1 Tax=Nyssa sinensis TaxID=561372 RepID=A0A5J4ZNG2_9ASTE|nr:hypothetical protein F0562_014441 [Nyssa sinensis]
MKVGEFVNEYFARALTIANRMKENGEDNEDVVVVEKILRFITPKFDYVVCSIEESKDTDTLTIDELQSSLFVHEQLMSSHVEEEHALKITHGDQSGRRGRGRGIFRGRGRGRGRQSFDKATVECYFDGSFRDSVKLGNNSSMVVTGKGNVRLQVNEIVQIITRVFYVPELKNNLLKDMVQLWHYRYGHLSFKGLKTLQQKKMVNGLPQLNSP